MRRSTANEVAIERDIRWLIDLPEIIELAEQQARLTSNVHIEFPRGPLPPLPGSPKDI